jgi:hypothetical protein
MYQNTFHPDDTRLRNIPLEYSFSPQAYVILPEVHPLSLTRRWAGEALITLGTWIKPQESKVAASSRTTVWQGR